MNDFRLIEQERFVLARMVKIMAAGCRRQCSL